MGQLFQNLTEGMENNSETLFQFLNEDEKLFRISYDKFYRDCLHVIGWLRERNVLPGDKVAILAMNCYEYLAVLLGIFGFGAVAVPLNPHNQPEELAYQITLTEPKLILRDDRDPELTAELPEGCLEHCESLQGCLQETCEAGENSPRDANSLALILFTSGTTGHSKGVMLTEKNLIHSFSAEKRFSTEILNFDSELFFAAFPFFHISGLATTLCWVQTGYPIVLCLDKRFFFRDLAYFPCTLCTMVPAELYTVANKLRRGQKDCIGSCKKIGLGAAHVDVETLRFFQENGITVYYVYGLSENSGSAMGCVITPEHIESVGKPYYGTEARLEEGEICLRGDGVTAGYYKNPEATAEAIRDGWFHTGDLGRVDADGYYSIIGRKKRLIILSSGENVSPEELEKLLLQNPEVAECLVKEEDGKICAEIYAKVEEAQIRAAVDGVNKSLPFYKRIQVLHLREEPFARTGTGKIRL